jgi:hypothetical protein
MRAPYCQACGTYVPGDTRYCPKCRTAHFTQVEAERLTALHPANESVLVTSRRHSKRQFYSHNDGNKYHLRSKKGFPKHCPWCGERLWWGEDETRPGTWLGLDKRPREPIRRDGVRAVGWEFHKIIGRDQIRRGGPYEEHSCTPEFDPDIGATGMDVWKNLVYVEALE